MDSQKTHGDTMSMIDQFELINRIQNSQNINGGDIRFQPISIQNV